MKIVFSPTKRKDTIELSHFYREPGDPPGSGKRMLCEMIKRLPPQVKFITLYASGGRDEENVRPKWSRFFVKDTRTFATWSKEQIAKWLKEHQVNPGFSEFILGEKIKESRKWLRVLASNEKLLSYYIKLGFKIQQRWLLPSVKMKARRSDLCI